MPRPSRRHTVRATAARLIHEQGYRSTTMDRLADEVGLNKGTLYHYYPSKSAILFELLSDQVDATLELIAHVPSSGTATERMLDLVKRQVDHVATKHDELIVFFQELPFVEKNLPAEQVEDLRRRINQYERFTTELLKEGVRSGEFRPLDIRMVMYSIIGILAYMPNWFTSSTPRSREKLVDQMADFVIHGLALHDP